MKKAPDDPAPSAPAAPRRRRRRAVEPKAAPWRPNIGGAPLPGAWRLSAIALKPLPRGFSVAVAPAPRLLPRRTPRRQPAQKPGAASRRVQASHPEVFRWRYYLDANPDLRDQGVRTRDQALRHWKARGIREGRHAHPAFSPVDYLRLHADVRLAARRSGAPPLQFAITHWLQQGSAAGRQGRIAPLPAPPPAPTAPTPAPTAPPPPPVPLDGLAARLAQILEGGAPEPAAGEPQEAPSYLNVELPPALRRLLKKGSD